MNCKPIFKTPPILYNFIACLLNLLLFAPLYGQDSGASVFKSFNENQAFTCITVDPNNNIWAGTKKSGLFMLDLVADSDATTFQKIPTVNGNFDLEKFQINALSADAFSNLWVGHEGLGGLTAIQGGLEQVDYNNPGSATHLINSANAKCFNYTQGDGLPTRNIQGVTVDPNGTVWTAHSYDYLFTTQPIEVWTPFGPDVIFAGSSLFKPGTVAYRTIEQDTFTAKGVWSRNKLGLDPELPYPASTCAPGATETPQGRSFSSIGSNENEVWVSSFPYSDVNGEYHPARILKYDTETQQYLGDVTHESIQMPKGGIFNGIYLDKNDDAWVTVSARKGLAVRKDKVWQYLDPKKLPCIFPDNVSINENAIWGNSFGNVFIGTKQGLIVYNGRGPVGNSSSYTLYNADNYEMVSENIIGGFSERDSIQWIVTDNGIMRAVIGRFSNEALDEDDFCNADIEAIENADYDELSKSDRSYHLYRIETELCSQDEGPNKENCTADYIYNMLKNNVELTTPIPLDYPYDDVTMGLLMFLNDSDLPIIQKTVNDWEPNPTPDNETGAIKFIAEIAPNFKKFLTTSLTDFPPINPLAKKQIEHLLLDSRAELYETQQIANKDEDGGLKAVSCEKRYLLYNSPNFIGQRFKFDLSLDNVFCENQLESFKYDPVFVITDDENYKITNYTAEGHFLSPGKVTRMVVEECGKVKILTIGEGTQFCNGALQFNALGIDREALKYIFPYGFIADVIIDEYEDEIAEKLVHFGEMNAKGNLVAGAVLFKNIDLRLKKAFEDKADE